MSSLAVWLDLWPPTPLMVLWFAAVVLWFYLWVEAWNMSKRRNRRRRAPRSKRRKRNPIAEAHSLRGAAGSGRHRHRRAYRRTPKHKTQDQENEE